MAHDISNHISPNSSIALPLAANQRLDDDFRHANRHSLMVRFLKLTLPVAAVGLVLWFGAAYLFRTERFQITLFDNSGISDGKLVMEAPEVKGFSNDDRPYSLNAKRAVQDLEKPGIVALERIDAILPTGGGEFADLAAKSGVYNSNKEWLTLKRDIVISRKDGTVIRLESAEVDLKSGALVSKKPVKVDTPTTNITADNMEVSDNGAVVVFKNRVRMVVQPSNGTN